MKLNRISILTVFIGLFLLFGCKKGKHYEFTDQERAFITYDVGDIIELECDCGQTFTWTITESYIEVRDAIISYGYWGSTDILVDHAEVKGGGFWQMMGKNDEGFYLNFHIDAYFNYESPSYKIKGYFIYNDENETQVVFHRSYTINNISFTDVYELKDLNNYNEIRKMFYNKDYGLLRFDYISTDGDGFCEIVL